MKLQLLLSLILISLFTQPLIAQDRAEKEITPETIKNIEKIFEYALKGYDELNGWHLARAAKVLIDNPHIQDFKKEGEIEKDSLEANEYYKDFFDPKKILADASKMAPIDARALHLFIKRQESRLPEWTIMSTNLAKTGGIIQVKNYMIGSKNSKTIKTEFNSNQKVTLSVRVGNDLRLSVFDTAKRKKVGDSKFIGDARMLSFTTESEGEHQIKIENVSSESNDCLLMIETRNAK